MNEIDKNAQHHPRRHNRKHQTAKAFRKVTLARGTTRPEGLSYNLKMMEVAGYLTDKGFRPVAAYIPDKGTHFDIVGEPVVESREVTIDKKPGMAIAVLRIESGVTKSTADDVQLRLTNLSSSEPEQTALRPGQVLPIDLDHQAPAHRLEAAKTTVWLMNRFCNVRGLFCEIEPECPVNDVAHKSGQVVRDECETPSCELLEAKNEASCAEAETPVQESVPESVQTRTFDVPDPATIMEQQQPSAEVESIRELAIEDADAEEAHAASLLCVRGENEEFLYVPLRALQEAIQKSVQVLVMNRKTGHVRRRAITEEDIKMWNHMAKEDAGRQARALVGN